MVLWEVLGVVVTSAAVVLTGAVGVMAREYLSANASEADPMQQAKLDAYEEIMAAVVELNRTAVNVGEERFHQEADKLLMDKDSVLEKPHSEVSATYQRYYYLLEEDVYDAISEYVNYLVEYHEDGARVDELLSLGGQVGAAMRDELDRSRIGHQSPDTHDGPPDRDDQNL